MPVTSRVVPPSLCILASSVCKSLQCLISSLTQGAEGGHLFKLTCSVVLWGGRNTANKYHWHVRGVYGPSVWTTLGLPQLMARVLSWSALLRLQAALQGNCPRWALGFVHFPALSCSGSRSQVPTKTQTPMGVHFVPFPGPSSSGDQVLGECSVPGGLCILITSLVPATQFPGCSARAPSQVCRVSVLGSWSLAATLLADVIHPGSQEDLLGNWEPAHSLVEDAVSGAEFSSFWLWLPPCLGRGMGQYAAG